MGAGRPNVGDQATGVPLAWLLVPAPTIEAEDLCERRSDEPEGPIVGIGYQAPEDFGGERGLKESLDLHPGDAITAAGPVQHVGVNGQSLDRGSADRRRGVE